MEKEEARIIRVSSTTNVKQISVCIIERIREGVEFKLRAVGASACNQMIKGLAIARGDIAVSGKDLLVRPGFETIKNDDGTEMTAIICTVVVH